MKVEFLKKVHIGGNLYSFYFKKPDFFRFIPGQYIQLSVNDQSPDDRGINRWFSLYSAPSEKDLVITTRMLDHPSTFKRKLFNLSPGDEVTMAPAQGDFVLPKNKSLKLVFIAVGIGITPFRSILKSISDNNDHRSIDLIHFSKKPIDFTLAKDFNHSANISFHQTQSDISVISGREYDLYFVSGPERAVEKLRDDLYDFGVDKSKVIVDYFHNYD